MDDIDPTLRCHICFVKPGKYVCPRCERRSCSVECIKTHKKRSLCNGVRDPTVPRPLSWLRTPAGVDHDYNFLSAIERKMDRNNQDLIEQGLLTKAEIEGYDQVQEHVDNNGNIVRTLPRRLAFRLRYLDLDVRYAPKGMTRQRENKTSLYRKTKNKWGINFTVEWLLVGISHHPALGEKRLGAGVVRVLHRAHETVPLYKALAESLKWHRRSLLTDQEIHQELLEQRRRNRKKQAALRRLAQGEIVDDDDDESDYLPHPAQNVRSSSWMTGTFYLQDWKSGSWSQDRTSEWDNMSSFYLHVPEWPAPPNKALMPMDSTETLGSALVGRTIIEFPTIYVFRSCDSLPDGFVVRNLERKSPRQKWVKVDLEEFSTERVVAGQKPLVEEVTSSEDDQGSGTSSSDPSSTSSDEGEAEGCLKITPDRRGALANGEWRGRGRGGRQKGGFLRRKDQGYRQGSYGQVGSQRVRGHAGDRSQDMRARGRGKGGGQGRGRGTPRGGLPDRGHKREHQEAPCGPTEEPPPAKKSKSNGLVDYSDSEDEESPKLDARLRSAVALDASRPDHQGH